MPSYRADLESLFQELPKRQRTPVSTYRVQFWRGFGFRDARAIVPYLAELGITDFYSSPILKARPGSSHGYDITDHNALNPELGAEGDFESLVQELQAHRMGNLLDFVPNHMAVDPEANPWWRDILENGKSSPYARYFDIHWEPIKPELKGKVLLPILGDQYGIVLERGEIALRFKDGVFWIQYFEHPLPVNPKQYPDVLRFQLDALRAAIPAEDTALREYLSIVSAFDNLPPTTDEDPERVLERRREKAVSQERLARLAGSDPRIERHIQSAVDAYNGKPGQPESFDALHALLEAQVYRLAYWKTAAHEINYRRFFDINALAGLRVENDPVFPQTHQLTMRLIADGKVTGLRIDHPDGLYDPAAYFEAVQDMFLRELAKTLLRNRTPEEIDALAASPEWREAVHDWRVAERKKNSRGLGAKPLYIVAEKILSLGEALDAHWAIDGTSGYDFLNDVNGLFIDKSNAARMREAYTRFTGKAIPFEVVAYVCKKLIMSTSLASELNVLAHTLNNISEQHRTSRDFTLDSLRDALKELIACFPVYRTYINSSRAGATDRKIIERAVTEAKRRNPAQETSIFDFIRSVLTPENVDKVSMEEFYRQLAFTMKFQQYTGPVQAKGLEDTAFYRYTSLMSLNEVGGDPARFGVTPAAFHEANLYRHEEWPTTLLATATHDTKRGEDARARLNVLSEIPEEWEKMVNRWAAINEVFKSPAQGSAAPERNDEYLYYQALLGAWTEENTGPLREEFSQRMRAYMLKAIKEAKLRSSWISPNEAYEAAMTSFVEKTLSDERPDGFLASFLPFAKRVAHWGMMNALSQLVLKIASPGAADFYQGSELWDLALVDPDNRRPVDFGFRQDKLAALRPLLAQVSSSLERQRLERSAVPAGARTQAAAGPVSSAAGAVNIGGLLRHWERGDIKMYMTACGLRFRRSRPDLFLEGDYLPLEVEGPQSGHVVAFARSHGGTVLLAVITRFPVSLVPEANHLPVGPEVWKDTYLKLPSSLAASSYFNLFTAEEIRAADPMVLPLADLLRTSPVGLFSSDPVHP